MKLVALMLDFEMIKMMFVRHTLISPFNAKYILFWSRILELVSWTQALATKM